MSDLDLDALERLYIAAMPPDFDDQLYGAMVPDLVDAFPALIQRLREAEAHLAAYENGQIHRALGKADARIARLERVREYADHKGDCDLVWRPGRPADAACSCGLYAALAAVEAESHAEP